MGRVVSILLPTLTGGGAERVCVNLANEFVGRGLSVRMVLMRAEGELLSELDPQIEVVDLGAERVRNALWRLVRHLRISPPNVILANIWPLTFLAALARGLSGASCRLVAVEHNVWSASPLMHQRSTRLAFKASMRWLLSRSDVLLGVSQGVASDIESFAGLPAGSVFVRYNPVAGVTPVPSATNRLPAGAHVWASGSSRRVLAVGKFKEQKNFPLLLEAFARLRKHIDARLVILGEGEMRPALEAQIQMLGLDDVVVLPGFSNDASSYYTRADLFVLSSESEGFGNVIVEALEQGVPVVSTDCPSGPREILEDGKYGRLVPVGNADALARAMLESLQSQHDHDALKARAQDFAVDNVADEYLDLLLPGWREASSQA